MIWKRSNKSMVGVDIGSSSVKAVELRGKGGDFQLLSLGYEGLQPDSVVDGQIMELNAVSTAIGNIFNEHKIKTTQVAAGVNGHSVQRTVADVYLQRQVRRRITPQVDFLLAAHERLTGNPVALIRLQAFSAWSWL